MGRKKQEEKVGQMRKEARGSRRRQEVVRTPSWHPWEGVKAEAGVGTGRGADSWPVARVTSPTVGRSKAKVSLIISVEPIPRESSMTVGSAGTPPTAEGKCVRLSTTHRRILETK